MHPIEERLNLQSELLEAKEQLLTDPSYMSELSKSEKFDLVCNIQESIKNLEENVSDMLLESNDMSNIEFLQEVNIRRLDKITKRNLRKLIIAIKLAKQANDPIYTKYARGVMLRKQYKALILKKYGNKAYQLAMQEESNSKK